MRQRESQREIAATVSEYLDLPLYFIPSDAIPSERVEIKSLIMRWQRWYLLEKAQKIFGRYIWAVFCVWSGQVQIQIQIFYIRKI